MVRKLLGLEKAIDLTVVDPVRDDRGWAFRDGVDCSRDTINGFAFLSEAYVATDPNFLRKQRGLSGWIRDQTGGLRESLSRATRSCWRSTAFPCPRALGL